MKPLKSRLACRLSRYWHGLGLTLLYLLVWLPAVSFAKTSATPMKFEYVFDIGGEPGFAIIHDRDGFLWFSSFYNGMLRFDGSGKWMIREGPDGISNDFVTQLFEDRDGREREKKTEAVKAIAGARVLLAEDNEINQQVAKEILEGAGLVVAIANDGSEAVEMVQSSEFEAVLMDIQMSVMDGYEATRRIRKWEGGTGNSEVGMRKSEDRRQMTEDKEQKVSLQPPTSNLPIIAMTAHAMAGDEQKSLEAGMNDHVTKPIDPDQLFATLQKWIKPVAERAAVQRPPVLDVALEPGQAVPDEDELPESLPGFDLASGLKRLRGNKRLYRKLLLDFGANYGDVADEIREALATKDFKQAHSLVHNLKGLSGNLEATDLQTAAVEMEKLVKGDQKETPPTNQLDQKFMGLEKAINQALEAVQTLGLPAEEKILEPSTEWLAEIPEEKLKEIANRIKAAVEIGDVTKIKSIADELKFESEAMAPFCDELVQLAEDFDFDGIQKLVLKLNS